MACISNKWPLPLSPQIKTLFTNSRLICDRLWVLIDAFRRRRSYYTALHPQVGHSPPGREINGVWWHTQPPTPHGSGNSRRSDHMRPGCCVLTAVVFVTLAINNEWVNRWPPSPVIEGQMSGRRWRNNGIVRHLEQSRPRGGPMTSLYGATALDRRVYWQLWGRTPSMEAFRWCRWARLGGGPVVWHCCESRVPAVVCLRRVLRRRSKQGPLIRPTLNP